MAIKPNELYSGQSNVPNGDYPWGSARNVNVPGDGTGWPFTAAYVNDIFGLLQALLTEAGITPTGIPDTVPASQYLAAIQYLITSRTDPISAVWTDVAAIRNFPHQFTDPDFGAEASSGRAVIWNPDLNRFYSINRSDSNTPTGWRLESPYADRTDSLTMDAGDGLTVHPYAALCSPAGKMVVGGAPASSSQSRYRSSLGDPWTARTSPKAADTTGPVAGVYAGGSIEKFFMGFASGHIESSSDAESWTAEATLSGACRSLAFSPTLGLLVSVSGTTTFHTSTDGTTWTPDTAPANFQVVFWSARLELFIAAASSAWYTSPDANTWTLAAAITPPVTTGATFIAEYNRVLILGLPGTLYYSSDDLASWVQFASTVTPAGPGTVARAWAIDPLRGTLCLASYQDGFHMVGNQTGP